LSGVVDFTLQEVKDLTNLAADPGSPTIDPEILEESKKLAALSLDDPPAPAAPEGDADPAPPAPPAPAPEPVAAPLEPVQAPAEPAGEPAQPAAVAEDDEEGAEDAPDGDEDANSDEGDQPEGGAAAVPDIFRSGGKVVDDTASFGRLPPGGPTKFQGMSILSQVKERHSHLPS
jgi:hypothetical protein